MLSMVSPLFFCPSKWVLCASKRRMHQSSLTFTTTSRTDTTGPWGKVAVTLVSFSTRRSLCSNIPGVVDSQHIRWRLVFHTPCVCSYYAPHAGVDESCCVHSARCQFCASSHSHTEWRCQCVAPPTMPSSLTFNNCLTWVLTIRNPRSRATHIAGAALDLVFVSSNSESSQFIVHQGYACCANSLVCCPQLDIRSFSLHVVTQRRPCGLHWFQQCETIPQGQVLVASPPTRPGSIGNMG